MSVDRTSKVAVATPGRMPPPPVRSAGSPPSGIAPASTSRRSRPSWPFPPVRRTRRGAVTVGRRRPAADRSTRPPRPPVPGRAAAPTSCGWPRTRPPCRPAPRSKGTVGSHPRQLADLGGVQQVAPVVARPVGDDLLERRRPSGGIEDGVGDLLDARLHTASHVVGLPHLAVAENQIDGTAVIVDVQPLPPVLGGGVERQGLVVEGLGREQRDDLLGELVGPVVVAAVGDGGREPEGLHVGPYGVVGAGLGGVVGRAGAVGRLLGEHLVRIEGQIPVDLAGGDVVEPRHAVTAGRLGQGLGAQDVGAEETGRVEDGQAVVRLGGEVDDDVGLVAGQGGRHDLQIADVTLDELDPVLHVGQVGPVSGVGEHVEGQHVVVGVVGDPVTDEVGSDEAGATGDE